MESTFRLLRVRGIEIGANWSFTLVFLLITASLATGFFPATYPGLPPSTYWTMAAITSVLFVTTLLLHELGHAFRALKEGMEIEGITLWLLGGVAKFKGSFPSAGAEFRIAIAGPAVTFAIIIVSGVLRWLAQSAGSPDVVLGVVDYIFQINITLLVFNMIPALPLDGGRVLRSALWGRKGDFLAATTSAARIARVFASAIIGLGILFALQGVGNGIFLALVGWFILQAGQAEVAYASFRQSLGGVRIRDLMTPSPEVIHPDMTVQQFVDDVAYTRGHSTYPVVDTWGNLVGLFSLRMAAAVPVDQRAFTRVGEAMAQADSIPVANPDAELPESVALMQSSPAGRAVVVEDGRVVGILTMADIARALELQQIRTAAPERPARRRFGTFLLVAGVLAVVGYLYSPPLVAFAPGASFDVTKDITVKGVEPDDVDGEYLLTSVAVQQPNVWGLLGAVLQGREIAALSDVVPQEADPDEYFETQAQIFKEAQTVAAAAAAKAAGMEVRFTGDGALIGEISPGSPAADVLKAGDVVIDIDGQRIRLADDLSRMIRSRPEGSTFEMTIERGDEERKISVRSRGGIVPGAPGIGVRVSTHNFDVDLPFEVEFRERDIGGPSAGLAYALAVYDLIEDSDLARGRNVATTGTMDIDGHVGLVGGVKQKTKAAEGADAKVFLVPEAEVRDVPGTEMDVIGVETLQDAIDALERRAG